MIDDHEYDFLYPQFPRTATFYSLPKIHKGLDPLKGCPIVLGVGSLIQNIGIYINRLLSPFVETLSSFVRDTTNLLKRLEGIVVEESAFLISIDVEALDSAHL